MLKSNLGSNVMVIQYVKIKSLKFKSFILKKYVKNFNKFIKNVLKKEGKKFSSNKYFSKKIYIKIFIL